METLRRIYNGATLSLWTSFTFGTVNALMKYQENFRQTFEETHCNHLERSFYLGLCYPFVMKLLRNKPVYYSYLAHASVLTYLYAHHYIAGSPYPIQGLIASSIVSTLITRKIIRKENKTIDDKL